jgi:hypothetical protein
MKCNICGKRKGVQHFLIDGVSRILCQECTDDKLDDLREEQEVEE